MKMRTISLLLFSCAFAMAQRPESIPPGPRGGGGPAGGSGISERPMGGMTASPGFGNDMRRGFSGGSDHGGRVVIMPSRPGGAPPVSKIAYFNSKEGLRKRVVIPPPFPRCMVIPDDAFWNHRDLMAEIKWLSRAGFLPVTPVDAKTESIVDYTWVPSGWKAYGIAIPAGGKIQVEVQHTKLGWFRLMAVDRWGKPGPGMLQAAIAHRPIMVTLTNPKSKPDAVYIVVDDPGWWSTKEDPYTLVIRRDWDVAAVDLSSVTMVTGLWGASPSNSAQFRGPSLTGPAVFPH